MPFATIEEALAEIRAGNFVIVVDDEDRENEGDFIMAAEFITPAAVNFMEIHARGNGLAGHDNNRRYNGLRRLYH